MGASAWVIANAALRPSIADLQVAIVGVRFFGLVRGILRYAERLTTHDVTLRVLAVMRTRFYAAIEPLAPAGLRDLRRGDLFSRIVSDIGTLQDFYVRVISPPTVALLIGVAVNAFLLRFSPGFSAVFTISLVVGGLAIPLAVHHLGRRDSRSLGGWRAALSAELVEALGGAADILAFGLARDRAQRIASLAATLVTRQARLARLSALQDAAIVLMAGLTLALLLLLGAPLVQMGVLTGVELTVVLLVSLAAFEAISPMPLALQTLDAGLEAGGRLLEVVGRPAPQGGSSDGTAPATPPRQSPASVPSTATVRTGVRFDDVCFSYDSGSRPALWHISFSLPKGSHAAIVGPSGGGKSTILNLILRLYEPCTGAILLDGYPIGAMNPSDVRRQVALAPQHPHFFNVTVRENLLIARPGAAQTDIEHAARLAQIHDTITAWPLGYDTVIGEAGLRLSGGERRRLSIARALLSDASIMLFDEPAAYLDPLTESALNDSLTHAFRQRTVLVVTHRLAQMQRFHLILVLQDGALVESGRHDDLLARRGVYWRLWRLQTEAEALDSEVFARNHAPEPGEGAAPPAVGQDVDG
jgi:thiol reductant ABC exporter CydC subunit